MSVTIDKVVGDISQLVSVPVVWLKINEMVNSHNSSIHDVGRVVSQDPGLTARVLSLANSAAFGLRTKVDNVNKAVAMVGMRRLRDMVLATYVVEAFGDVSSKPATLENFWKHSIYCGLAARYLAYELQLEQSDALFVAGLLHDLGQLVMFRVIPDLEGHMLTQAVEQQDVEDLHEVEQKLFGFDHAMLGGELATQWKFSDMLSETIRYHHDIECAEKFPLQTAIVNIANCLAVAAELDTTDITVTDAPPVDPKAWLITGLDESVIEPAVLYAREQFSEMRSALFHGD